MKIIFLDIDGVLNSENHGKEMHELFKQGKITEKKYYNTWDLPYKDTILPLKKIVDETGAQIVLSSSWRLLGRKKMLNDLFKPYKIEIIDQTGYGVRISELEKLGFNPEICYDRKYWDKETAKTYDRGAEIAQWLFDHPDVDQFVILDDDWCDIEPYYPNNFVRTDFYNWGLTFELADKAIDILNKGVSYDQKSIK